jgi:hypothetical protein
MKTVIQDTAEIFITNVKTGKVVMFGEAQIAGISQSLTEEKLKGGIGNKTVFLLRSDKEMNLNITSATFDAEFFAITQGVSINTSGEAEITKNTTATVADNLGTLEFTVKNLPVGVQKVSLTDIDGTQQEVDVVAGVAELPVTFKALENATLEVFYKEKVQGNSVELNSNKFPDKYKVEYRTISYGIEDANVYSDIYFIFDECIPSGAFEMSLQNGQAYTPEMNFSVMNPINSDVMGQKIEVLRTP